MRIFVPDRENLSGIFVVKKLPGQQERKEKP